MKQRFRSPGRKSVTSKKVLAPIQTEQSSLFTKGPTPLESIRDPLEIVERLRQEPELGFFYLTPVAHRQSVNYDPYNLKYVYVDLTITLFPMLFIYHAESLLILKSIPVITAH